MSTALELYHVHRNPFDHRLLIHTVAGFVRAVAAGSYPPIRDWYCKGCPFAGPCLLG